MTEPKISVVMPVYNTEEEFLREAIESVLNQTFTDFEFIIINDASTNNAEEIILSYKDERIKYIKNEQNSGVAKTLNVGLNSANGKYIARMDADDVSMKNRFEVQYKFLEENPQYQLCATRITKAKGKGSPRAMNSEYIKAKLVFRGNCIVHPTVMFNNAFFAEHSLSYNNDISYSEDWDLWFRLCLVGNLATVPDKLVYYRQHPNQVNKLNSDRHYELGKKQFERNLTSIGFVFREENKELFLNFLAAYETPITFKEWKIIFSETMRLLAFAKSFKKVSYKYTKLILFKKLLSYTKKSLIFK